MFTMCPILPAIEWPVSENPKTGQRAYCIEGNFYPSMTTVLGQTADKSYLAAWKEKLIAKGMDPEVELKRCADRGKKLHSMVEKYMRNEPNYAENQEPLTVQLFNQIRLHVNQIKVIQAQELILFSHRLGMAGRVDLIADDTIIDFKGATNTKKDEWLNDYRLQVTGYGMMLAEMMGNFKIRKYKIILASENYGAQVVTGDIEPYMADVVRRRNMFYDGRQA